MIGDHRFLKAKGVYLPYIGTPVKPVKPNLKRKWFNDLSLIGGFNFYDFYLFLRVIGPKGDRIFSNNLDLDGPPMGIRFFVITRPERFCHNAV